MKCKQIAEKIDAHLKRFEADPVINAPYEHSLMKLHPYWNVGACFAGRWISIWYVSCQGHSNICKADAEAYLEWLDAGNIGHHWEALRDKQGRKS